MKLTEVPLWKCRERNAARFQKDANLATGPQEEVSGEAAFYPQHYVEVRMATTRNKR